MNTQVLRQAEQLFRAGRRHAAVALLEEHMRTSPTDRQAATVLGRIYVNLQAPQKAAHWLRLSLEMERRGAVQSKVPSQQLEEPVGADELDYIGADVGQESPPECDVNYEYGFDASPAPRIPDSASCPQPCVSPELGKVLDKAPQDSVGPESGQNRVNTAKAAEPLPEDELEFTSEDLQFLADDEQDEGLGGDDLNDLLPAIEVDDGLDEPEGDPEQALRALDDIELLDTTEEETLEELPVRATRLDDYRRARQVAAQLIEEAGWGREDLDKVAEVLAHHRSHGKTRAALRQLMQEEDITSYELVIMHDLRLQWGGGGYNRCFRRGKAADGWPNVSWRLALRLLRELETDSADEILAFVDDCFEQWNNSPRMLRAFPIFVYYLENVIEHMVRVAEVCGQRMPPYIDFDLFPDHEGDYDSWRLHEARFPFGYSIDTVMPQNEDW